MKVLYTVLIVLIYILVNQDVQTNANRAANHHRTSSASSATHSYPYKINSATISRNGKRIGTINDDEMRYFRPVSSHGREDVFSKEDNDTSTINYRAKLMYRGILHLINFSPVIFTCPLAFASTSFRDFVWYDWIRFGLGRGGAAFIKWGQWSSTRPDIFPEELCKTLSKLQASAPAHSYSYTKRAIKDELGERIEDIFDYFDKEPLASGSIAQVYRAILNGQEVAVKVRHPNVFEQIKLDFTIMKAVANFLHQIPGCHWLNLPESIIQFSGTIASQTQLDVEGRHLVLFNRYFRKWKKAHFPKPIMFTDGVLVESFEHGELVADFSKRMSILNSKGIPMSARDVGLAHFIVTIGEDIYLKMLIEDNLMHADLHPGNILVQHTLHGIPLSPAEYMHTVNSPSAKDIETEVVLVDAGMVASLTSEERSNFIGLLEAAGDGNGSQAAYYLSKFSNKHYSEEAIQAFQHDTDILFSKICRGYGTKVDIGEVMRGILSMVRKHHIIIDANYATLFMNALCLDGLSKAILPSYNVLDGAMNLLKLHQLTRRIPIPGANDLIVRTGLPIARWLKKKFDKSFLKDILQAVREKAHSITAKIIE